MRLKPGRDGARSSPLCRMRSSGLALECFSVGSCLGNFLREAPGSPSPSAQGSQGSGVQDPAGLTLEKGSDDGSVAVGRRGCPAVDGEALLPSVRSPGLHASPVCQMGAAAPPPMLPCRARSLAQPLTLGLSGSCMYTRRCTYVRAYTHRHTHPQPRFLTEGVVATEQKDTLILGGPKPDGNQSMAKTTTVLQPGAV